MQDLPDDIRALWPAIERSRGSRPISTLRLCGQFQIAVGKADSRALGLACIAKQLTFERIEAVSGCEKPVAFRIPNHDSRRLRSDFDDVITNGPNY